jgi:hypothetical protein
LLSKSAPKIELSPYVMALKNSVKKFRERKFREQISVKKFREKFRENIP